MGVLRSGTVVMGCLGFRVCDGCCVIGFSCQVLSDRLTLVSTEAMHAETVDDPTKP
jgi:hypothetical protein